MALSKRARQHLSWILMILCALAGGAYLIFAEGGYLSLRESQQELDALQRENQRLERQRQEYWDRIEKLKHDPREKERVLREGDYAKPNEIIIEIPEEPPADHEEK